MRTVRLVALAVIALIGCQDAIAPVTRTPPFPLGSVALPEDRWPGRYVVLFKYDTVADVRARAAQIVAAHGGRLLRTWPNLQGFAAELPDGAVGPIASNPLIAVMGTVAQLSVTESQPVPPWNLDRIDVKIHSFNNNYNYYTTGTGVHAYILDTGINPSHTEFAGRVGASMTFAFDNRYGDYSDCHGHGTHVSAILGGTTYGVAKNVSLHALRWTENCTGTGWNQAVMEALDWLIANAQRPAVLNFSATINEDATLDSAFRRVVANNIVVVASAGNGRENDNVATSACNQSPSRVSEVIAVSATDSYDYRPNSANYGNCVDIFAPGVDITSAWIGSNTASRVLSGTSLATPHVAGVAVLYLESSPTRTPAQVWQQISDSASAGVVGNLGTGSPDRLIYSAWARIYGVNIDGPSTVTTAGNYTYSAALYQWGTADSFPVKSRHFTWGIDHCDASGCYAYETSSGWNLTSVNVSISPTDKGTKVWVHVREAESGPEYATKMKQTMGPEKSATCDTNPDLCMQ